MKILKMVACFSFSETMFYNAFSAPFCMLNVVYSKSYVTKIYIVIHYGASHFVGY